MSAVVGALLDALQIAHDTQIPHQEPVKSSSGGGAGTAVIVVGIVVSLALVAGLVWVKKRTDA